MVRVHSTRFVPGSWRSELWRTGVVEGKPKDLPGEGKKKSSTTKKHRRRAS